MHIPKAGGTSLGNMLASQFNQELVWPGYYWEDIDSAIKNPFAKYKYIAGHFGYKTIESFGLNPLVITLLREPVSRVISLFKYLKKSLSATSFKNYKNPSISHLVHKYYLAVSGNIDDFINTKDSDIISIISNAQTRQLIEFSPYQYRKLQKSDLDIAIKNLKAIDAVGVMEKFGEFTQSLNKIFNLKLSSPVHLNSTIHTPDLCEISPLTKDKIISLNLFDIELYFEALNLIQHL